MDISAPAIPQRRLIALPALRRALAVLIGVVAVTCALLGQHPADSGLPAAPLVSGLQSWLSQQWGAGSGQTPPGWVVIASLLAIAGGALAIPAPFIAARVLATGAEAWRRVAIAGGVLGGSALVAAGIWLAEPFKQTHAFVNAASTWAALLWVAGMIGCLVYLWPDRRATEDAAVERPQRWLWLLLEGGALLVILDIAAGLRLWHLGTLPEGIWFDEVDSEHAAQSMLSLPFQPIAPVVGHIPSLYFYVLAAILRVAGDSVATIRLPAALFGLTAVVAVYCLGRRVGGPALGLCAAALLGVAQWAVDFSRFGLPNIAAPALIGLGFVFLACAMERPRAFWFGASGMALGLSLLTYQGAILAGGAVAFVVVGIRLAFDGAFRRAAWPGVLLLPAGLVVGAAPLLVVLQLDSAYTLSRESTVSLFNEYGGLGSCLGQLSSYLKEHVLHSAGSSSVCLDALQANVQRHLLMFSVLGDSNGRHNLPGAPMVDAVTGAALLLGVGMCLRRIGHWFYQLLLLWAMASLLGGILSLDWEAPQGARTIGVIAPVCVIAALPLAALARGVWAVVLDTLLRSTGARAVDAGEQEHPSFLPMSMAACLCAAAVAAVPLGVAFARNYDGYFVRHAHDVPSWSEMGGRQAVVGRAAAALAAQGYTVRVSSSLAGDPALVYAAGNLNPPAFDPDIPVQPPVTAPGLALIMPVDDADEFSFIHRLYPAAPVIPLTPRFDTSNVQLRVVLVRPEDEARNLGVDVQFKNGTSVTRESHVQGGIAWPSGSTAAATATVHGTLLVSKIVGWQQMAIRVAGARQATLTLDGQVWHDGLGGTGLIRLGAGNHSFEVEAHGAAGPTLALQWTEGAGTTQEAGLVQPWFQIPPQYLAAPSLPSGGLLGLYFAQSTINGPVALARVDQMVNTYYQNPPPNLQFPFSARWQGTLRIDQDGYYSFRIDSAGPSGLFVDGRQILVGEPGGGSVGSLRLKPGMHAIRIDYNATGGYLHCYFTWQPPGQVGFVPVPPSVTEPAHG